MIRLITSAALALTFITPLHAAEASLDKAARAIAGREASFKHSFTPKGFKNPQVESGSVVFGTIPQMRWTYSAPEQKVFVFDGQRSWFFVPADRQVTVAKIDEAKKRDLPFLLLGDPAARARNFNVTEKKQGNFVVTTLQAKGGAALVKTATITTTPADNLVRRIDYTDRDGNRTSFEFSGYHPANASGDAFRFTPPAGVQVVEAQ